jgi:hypothetical protein
VHDSHAEAGWLTIRVCRDLAELVATATPAAAATAATPTPTPTSSAAATGAAAVSAEIGHGTRRARSHREPDVRVAATGALCLAESDIGQPLELRLQHAATRRGRNELGNEIA